MQNHFYISYNKNRPTATYKWKDTKEKAIVKVLKESNLSALTMNIAQTPLFSLSGDCSVRRPCFHKHNSHTAKFLPNQYLF